MQDLADVERSLQIHVIYAHASDTPDNSAALAAAIVTDIKAIDDWWQSRDPTRAPRWDFAIFAGCPTQFGQIDISLVWLPNVGAYYADKETALDRIRADVVAAGFDDPNKKYFVYYDGAFNSPQTCGVAANGTSVRDGGAGSYAFVFIAACAQVIGMGTGQAAITGAHEIGHQLGALASPRPNPGPPIECAEPNTGHPCDSMMDLMTPVTPVGATPQDRDLDTNNDQYYNHGQSWWDIRLSLFLRHIGDGDTVAPTGPPAVKIKPTLAGNSVDIVVAIAAKAKDANLYGYRLTLDGEHVRNQALQYQHNGETLKLKEAKDFASTNPKQRTTVILGRFINENGKKKRRFKPGKVVVITVQAIDAWGLLGPLATLRYKVGHGVLGKKGNKVKRDHDGPKPPKQLGPRATTAAMTFRFRKTTDTVSAVKTYFLYRNGKRFKTFKAKALPSGKVVSVTINGFKKGTYTIVAGAKTGNFSQPSNEFIF